ncbi:MAG: putative Molybdate transporter, periplasmic binding protein [Nitrospira sp.]|jgi:molybdate transport system substrate-binding protein|nr:putative Molybdate transporter, periplasmic binding protein [Nitrospira sp.]
MRRRVLLYGVPLMLWIVTATAYATEALIIAASPSVAPAVEALGRHFETTHPDVRVRLYLDSGLDLRRTIAGMENHPRGQYFIGSGPIHLVAPGGDELLTRLEQKYYVLPGTTRPYAEVPLVMVVPEALVDAPTSFEALASNQQLRIAVGDPDLTTLGQETKQLLTKLGVWSSVERRLDEASDTRSVLDHLLNGQADVGIVFGPDAVQESQRVRIVAIAEPNKVSPIIHSMAMERYCPNRRLCEEFLKFIQSADAQAELKRLGFTTPASLQALTR